jgi:RNA polymerase sigma factor (sigma-70 family)
MNASVKQAREEWLVLRCQHGEPAAFGDLVREMERPLLIVASPGWVGACPSYFEQKIGIKPPAAGSSNIECNGWAPKGKTMTTSHMSEIIQQLRRTVLRRDGAGCTDGQLLEDFISRRDEAAVAALVHRHGPMVWGVCHRVLRNYQDAEDAFQATFLVFVRRAASISSRELLANWLYGVAHQTAFKARATAARRHGRERQVAQLPEAAAAEPEVWRDLRPLLDEELARLPDKYRAVIVLCDLQDKTRKEVAQQLHLPEGTVAGRLARARTMLAKRLARRGVSVSGGLLGVMLSAQAVPATVMCSTIQAASGLAAGKTVTAAGISANALALARGVLKTMQLTKLTMVTGLLLFSLATLTTALLAWGQPPDQGTPVPQPAAKADKQAPGAQQKEPAKKFTNAIGMKFVWIPPGSFIMGSPKTEPERLHDETQHKVTLTKGFYLGIYNVTQEQWQEIMGNNPSQFRGEKNLPVGNVSWSECQEFCKKMKERDKKPYRLPTEAEREYACRAGTTTAFHFGDTISTDQANYDGNGVYPGGKPGINRDKPLPVGSFAPNAWGLYDMHGNMVMWCQDWLGDYPHKDVVDPQGPDKGTKRVTRGGSYYGYPQYLRSAFRYGFEPDSRVQRVGLRVCFGVD